MSKRHWLDLVAVVVGALVWIGVAHASGRVEAWDSDLYFSAAMPAMCLTSFALAYVEPTHTWRWGVLPSVGQFAWMLLTHGPGNLLPLGIVAFGLFSIPSIVAARAGAWIAGKRMERS